MCLCVALHVLLRPPLTHTHTRTLTLGRARRPKEGQLATGAPNNTIGAGAQGGRGQRGQARLGGRGVKEVEVSRRRRRLCRAFLSSSAGGCCGVGGPVLFVGKG